MMQKPSCDIVVTNLSEHHDHILEMWIGILV